MKLHTLKIQPCYYFFVNNGMKKAELRKNDRDYQVGDLIHFVNLNSEDFLNNSDNVFQITHILEDVEEFGLDKDYCILSIEKLKGVI